LLVHKKAATKLSLQKTDDEPMNGGTYIWKNANAKIRIDYCWIAWLLVNKNATRN
jgi:hypothetical protein